ncbi:MAG: MFS transporter [Pedosphaera sp.]|nr:MFS transporter [Pedosphaera sp.]
MRKPSLLIIFLTVFIDLVGFGIVLPLLPVYSRNFGASGFMIGAIIASYSLMQFLFAPVWGRLSDRIGRRPVLLVSTAGAVFSYVTFALGSGLKDPTLALGVLLGSRVLAGVCGANITVAQAYIADITPPADRSKKMGLIGMAFGLGFIFGPAIGGYALKWSGITAPGWIAAGLCAVNFLLTLAILPESWKPDSNQVPQRPHLAQWTHTLQQPKVGLLIFIFFLATFCFTCFETTLGLMVGRNFGLDTNNGEDAKTIAFLFAYCGIVSAFVQGGGIGRAIKKMGEPKLIAASLILTGISLLLLPFPKVKEHLPLSWGIVFSVAGLPWVGLLASLAMLAIGSGMTRPPVFGMISNLTPANEQGAAIGIAQSAGSLARIAGPIFAATLFFRHQALPYLICGGLALFASAIGWRYLCAPMPDGD